MTRASGSNTKSHETIDDTGRTHIKPTEKNMESRPHNTKIQCGTELPAFLFFLYTQKDNKRN